MQNLLNLIQTHYPINAQDIALLKRHFIEEKLPAQTKILEAGKVERYIYFLNQGIVKGYQNIDGKIVVQHLVAEQDFFTSLDSFMNETPSLDNYETVTDCELIKITKPDYTFLKKQTAFWSDFVKTITDNHLNCKLERVKDFQVLTAKARYLKFIKTNPNLALNVSVENIASFLGMEPQSLSRIRKQVTF